MLQTVLLTLHILVSAALIALVLMQHGRGADAGAAFGSGGASTVFGSRGAGGFLTRATTVLATLFFVISLSLAYLTTQDLHQSSVVDRTESALQEEGASDLPTAPIGDGSGAGGSDVPTAPGSGN